MAVAFIQDHWVQDRAVDMTGQVVNGCRVIERALTVGRSARWRLVASCGCTVLLTRDELLRRVREGLGPYVCEPCRKNRPVVIPETKECCVCHEEKHNTEFYRFKRRGQLESRCKKCWNRKRDITRVAEPIDCKVCCDQPWRRDPGGCECGGEHHDEDMRTVRYHVMTNNRCGWVMPNCDA